MSEGDEKPMGTRLPREVWVLAIVGFLIAVGFGVMSPVLPIYARTFGVSGFLAGLVISSMSVLRLVSMPPSSRLMRWVGPREMAILGCVLVALTTFMTGIADTYFGLLLWRGLTGVGSAMYGVSSMALLFAAAPPHMRGRASSLSGGGFVLGGMAGPALGGLIADISMQAPFFFYAVTMLLGGMVVMILLPRTPTQQREQMRDQTLGLTDLIKDSRFRAAMVVNFATHWQSFGVRSLLVPLFVVESLTMTTTWVGIAFTLAAITQALTLHLVGTGTDRLGRRFMLIAGGITTASASIGLALTGSYVGLVLLMCIYSVGASATLSASQAMLADIVPVSASSGIAAYQMSGDIGLILGPMIAGFVLDALSLSWAWVLGALIISMGVVMCWFTPKNPSSISNTD